jgi:hypothetical protein
LPRRRPKCWRRSRPATLATSRWAAAAGGGFGKGGLGYGKRGIIAEPGLPTGLNPLVVAAFKDAHPQSMQDVDAIYTKLFASCESQAQAYLKACSEAKSLPVPGFDPAMVQLLEYPFQVEAGGALTTDHLRQLINGGRRSSTTAPVLFSPRSTNSCSPIPPPPSKGDGRGRLAESA